MPSPRRWLTLLRGAIGFVAGFTIWWVATPSYNELVRKAAEPIVRLSESPAATLLRLKGREVLVVRTNLPRGTNRPGIPLYDLTFNFVLLTTLFALDPHPFSNRNVLAFLLALLLIYLGHLFGLLSYINDLFARDAEQGRVAEYSAVSRAFWHKAIYFYRSVGGLAFAVGIWWLLLPQSLLGGQESSPPPSPTARKRRREKGVE